MSLVFPPSLTPSQVEWEFLDNVIVNESPLSRAIQRTERGGRRWQAAVTMPTLEGEDAAIFRAFMSQASRATWFYLHNPGHAQRGSFDSAELLTNGDFSGGTTGWTASGATISEGSRLLRIENSGAATGRAYQDFSLTAGDTVVGVVDVLAGSTGAVKVTISDVGTGTVLATLAVASDTDAERIVLSATAANTGTHRLSIYTNTSTTGDYAYAASASVSKCALVKGASQTGGKLTIDALPASTNGLLRAGDMACFYVDSVPHLVELTRDLDSNASGEATMFFEPPLPGSPADNAPVIFAKPFARMFIPKHGHAVSYTPPKFQGNTFSCVEDITR